MKQLSKISGATQQEYFQSYQRSYEYFFTYNDVKLESVGIIHKNFSKSKKNFSSYLNWITE